MCSDHRHAIEVVEASIHNLQNVSCTFPHRALTVVTGVSGSGKSSLAFDTVYAEGQRRYVETLSTYARQFLEQMSRPPVRALKNMPPALALRQGNSISNARSTVATVTEIGDLLRLLFAGAGTTSCTNCGLPVEKYSVGRVCDVLVEGHENARIVVLGTIFADETEDVASVLRSLAADGYRRVEVGGELVSIDSVQALETLSSSSLRVVMDRLKVERESPRLAESIEKALNFGECVAEVVLWDEPGRPELRFFDQLRCTSCATVHMEPVPALFDRSSAVGACTTCGGYGRTVGIDPHKVIPDARLTLAAGAIAPFQTPAMRVHQRRMIDACHVEGVPTDVPWKRLDARDRRRILGRGFGDFGGVQGFFGALEGDRYKPHIRVLLARYRGYADCIECEGSGLSLAARSVTIADVDLGALEHMRIEEALEWFQHLELDDELAVALEPLMRELTGRFEFLDEAGVGYLSVDRSARTLSGGEMHRVLLATSVGRMLTDTCYVLDEPTAGLHPHDTERLMQVVTRLRDLGNTVLVVEHDPAVMALADHIVEMGPKGGDQGGKLLFEGSYAELATSDTPTGHALRARTTPRPQMVKTNDFLTIAHASLHNLEDVSVSFPIGRMSVVTGVSGSGKSSLVHGVLHSRVQNLHAPASADLPGSGEIHGLEGFSEVVLVDQGSISKSTRSCALTFSGAYTRVRELFASTDLAKRNGFTAGAFSFNTKGGRCERCEGTGTRTVEMHFMADVHLVCDVCDGRRFTDELLAIRYHEMTISDVFELTVSEALDRFSDDLRVTKLLSPLARVGLGYIKLGQSTSQLSGGELQRLKLASYVGQSNKKERRLFLFDEPTVGLHLFDVDTLVSALRELVDEGNTVIAVEHNLDFVAACDWVVDLGPGAGPDGGLVMYEGPVSELPTCEKSRTAEHLRRVLAPAP